MCVCLFVCMHVYMYVQVIFAGNCYIILWIVSLITHHVRKELGFLCSDLLVKVNLFMLSMTCLLYGEDSKKLHLIC